MAPVIMGNPDRPELGEELTNSFCRADPEIAAQFARATFLGDNRADLGARRHARARAAVLRRRDRARGGRASTSTPTWPTASYVLLDATGHCPNLSAPDETVDAIEEFLAR